ncbi:MAG: polysaccharide deacetylase family protein [Candidatus Deferrimicrobium sp.]
MEDKLSPTGLIIPYYHMVSEDRVDHVCNLYEYKGIRSFTDDLDHLLRHFVPVGLGDLLKTIDSGRAFARRSFHLTFDDGFRELHDVVAPILLRKGVPATFFVNSAFTGNKALCFQHKASILAERAKEGISGAVSRSLMERMKEKGLHCTDIPSAILSIPYSRKEAIDELGACMGVEFDVYLTKRRPYLDSSQIRRLIGQGFTIGSHSIDHPHYADIDFDEQVRQTLESTRWVREQYALGYGAFAFPHTDRGVEDRLFSVIQASGWMDVSFGTGGMINERLSRHLQRFSLEKPLLPAGRIIAMQYSKRFFRGSLAS